MQEWILKRLSLLNYKNYQDADFEFSPQINFIVGPNGAGKTNILDAIHYLSTGKSYFNPTDAQNVRHGETAMSIMGEFVHNESTERIHLAWDKRKILKRNDEKYKRMMDHVGLIPVVVISPADRDLIVDGSESRRRFLDSTLSQIDPVYLDHLVRYHNVLKQRNALLKKGISDLSLLEIYDEQFVAHGIYIAKKRQSFCDEFAPQVANHYTSIADGVDAVSLKYNSKVDTDKYLEQLRLAFAKDRVLEHSTFGIHRDDLDCLLEERPIKKFGSQGQQKTFSIALKLAQFDYLMAKKGFKPILLLDDIFDKLDASRVKKMVENVSSGVFGQIFITDTHPERVEQLSNFTGLPIYSIELRRNNEMTSKSIEVYNEENNEVNES